ncbi:Ger(x)C family spore germination protein [Ornithinibacillus sp. L9]|uniref:Ger(X)C family spore germination protein n=1 Tax=Ornithinibacillus caprae TaxID=2678566 RepID=A0A6N8FNY7_9BACI|nr:Ger(x)C family spore germination protein [Ornithinibacillus caprae]MUK90264.1 Ger(x)C family spore germination protein [Ornithinibacillus caprae]
MTKQKSLFKMLCLLSFLLLLLSGCWDQKEVEKMAYVVAIGLDQDEEDENRVKITYLISNPEVGSLAQGGGAAGEEPPREIISFTADDFITSRNLANTVVAKEITYDLLRILVVSEDFAKNKKFLRWLYDATKEREIRRDIKILVTKEQTSSFMIDNQPLLETRPHEYFEMLFNRGKKAGMVPSSDLLTFFRITEADADLFAAAYGTAQQNDNSSGKNKDPEQAIAGELQYGGETNTVQYAGSALFKEGIMIDTLTIEETRLMFLLHPTENPVAILTNLPDPFNEEYQIATRIRPNGQVKFDMNLKKETPSIDVTVPVIIEVLTNHSGTNFAKDSEKRIKLKESFEDRITKKFEELIKKTQDEYGTEPFGWSLVARKEFLRISDWESFDWMKTYPDIEINVSTEVRLGNFGRQGEMLNIKDVRD